MNRVLKGMLERLVVASGGAAVAARRCAGRSLVLAYHDVVPDGEPVVGDASLHLPRRDFARQLELIAASCDVVPLASLDAPPRSERPRVAITFDDAYTGAVEIGVAELAGRGMPATVFVAPGLLGQATWWDLLALGDDADRAHALSALGGRHDAVLAWAASRGLACSADVPRIATEEQLARAADTPGITLGAHSWGHPNLAALDAAELEHELRAPLAWLNERFPDRAVPWLAYPYGLFTAGVERAAAAAGYVGAFRVDGGWERGAVRTHARPRWNVPSGVSTDGFRLRLSGIGA